MPQAKGRVEKVGRAVSRDGDASQNMVDLMLIFGHSLRQQRWRFRVYEARKAQQEACDQGFEGGTDGRRCGIYHNRDLTHAERKSTEA